MWARVSGGGARAFDEADCTCACVRAHEFLGGMKLKPAQTRLLKGGSLFEHGTPQHEAMTHMRSVMSYGPTAKRTRQHESSQKRSSNKRGGVPE